MMSREGRRFPRAMVLALTLAFALTALAGLLTMEKAAATIVVINGDWTVSGTDNVYDGITFKVDGSVTIQSGALLEIRNGGLIFLEDSSHVYSLDIQDGPSGHGSLLLDNSILTTEPNQLSDYLKLDVTVAGTLILQNGAKIKHPGTLTTSGDANVEIWDSEITGFETAEIQAYTLDPNDNNDAPVMEFADTSTILFARARISRLYENPLSPGPDDRYNTTVRNSASLTVIDSYVGVDFLNSPTQHNVIAVLNSANVYIYNMTLDQAQSDSVNPSSWVPALVPVGSSSTFYIHRWLDALVTDRFGSATPGAYVESRVLPTGVLAYYPDNGNANVPGAILLGYMGKTAGDFNVTDATGRARIPLLTEWIDASVADPTEPNSNFDGNYRIRASFQGDVNIQDTSFSAYPAMRYQDNNLPHEASLTNLVRPAQDNTYVWSSTLAIDYDVQLDGNLRITGDVTMSGAQLTILQGDLQSGRHYVMIEGTGSLTIQDGGLASNMPLVVYLRDSGQISAVDSQLNLSTGDGRGVIYGEQSSVISIQGGNLRGDVVALGSSAALKGVSITNSDMTFDASGTSYLWDVIFEGNVDLDLLSDDGDVGTVDFDIRNVTFDESLSGSVVFTGTQYAQLTNVTFTSGGDWWTGRIAGSAKVGLYWWLYVQSVDATNTTVFDSNITLERLDPTTLQFSAIPAPGPDDLYMGTWTPTHVEAPQGAILYRALSQERLSSRGWSNSTYRANGSKVVDSVTFYADSNRMVAVGSNTNVSLVFTDLTAALSITSVTFSGANGVSTSQPVSMALDVKAQVRNDGKVDISGVTVHFYRTDVDVNEDGVMDNTPGDYSSFLLGEFNVTIQDLSTYEASMPWTPTAAGTYVISAVVDQWDAKPELDETNNILKGTVQVVTWPNLSVQASDVTLSRVPVVEGQVDVLVKVRNQGAAVAQGASVLLYDNGTLAVSVNIDVAVGSSTTASLRWSPPVPGDRLLRVVVLSKNDTASNTDFSMDDNSVEISVSVLTKPDLEVRPSEFQPLRVVKGKTFTVPVVVYNIGNTDASNFDVGLYLNEVTPENLLAVRVGLVIPAGSNLSLLLESKAINTDGNFTLIILVDASGVIPEVREDNNRVDITLEVVPPEGQVFITSPQEGRSYSLGDQIFVSGRVSTPTGQPIPDMKITLVLRDPEANFYDSKSVFTDQNGEFVVGLMLPAEAVSGEWTLLATAEAETIEAAALRLNVARVVPWYELTVPMVNLPLWMLLIVLAIFIVVVIAITGYMKAFGLGHLVECGECGAFIPESSPACPKCGTEFEQEMAKCSSCHAWIPVDVKKCPECGVEFTTGKAKAADYKDRMRRQYEQVVDKYRAEAARALGHRPSEKEFQEWWRRQPTYVTFKDWLKEEEEMRKMGSKPCPRCGTLNSITATICHKCGTLMSGQAPPGRGPPGGPSGGPPGGSGLAPRPPAPPPATPQSAPQEKAERPVLRKIVKKPFSKKDK